MPARRKVGLRQSGAADREFEMLLRRASAYYKARKPKRISKISRKHRAT